MITDKMTLWMIKHIATLPLSHPHFAIFDWIALGRYTGFCALEWCQTTKSDYKCIASWPLQPPKAFIRDDFEFFLNSKIPVLNITITLPSTISLVCICWRRNFLSNTAPSTSISVRWRRATHCSP